MKRTITAIIVLTAVIICFSAFAEDRVVFILCNPKSYVCVRRTPRKGNNESGRLDCGDNVITDGKTKNGFLHVLGITENGDGWVYMGYVVDDQPIVRDCHGYIEASGRVMTRRYINSKRSGWVEINDEVKIYAMTEQWAVTNRGFIKTKYLEVWYE